MTLGEALLTPPPVIWAIDFISYRFNKSNTNLTYIFVGVNKASML